MRRLSDAEVESRLLGARGAYGQGNVMGALSTIDEILSTNPDSLKALFGRGMILFHQNHRPEALACFRQVLSYDAKNREALFWAAQTAIGVGDGPQAESLAVRLTQLDPRNDRAHFLLSTAQTASGKWRDAAESVESALSIKPNELNYLVARAQLLVKLHFHSLAIEAYRRALSVERGPQILKELSDVLLEEGQTSEALSLLEEINLDITQDYSIQVLLARAYSEVGQPQQADESWSKARILARSDAEYIRTRAKQEIATGQIEKAEEMLREGLESEPSNISLFGLLAMIVTLSEGDLEYVDAARRELSDESVPAQTRQNLSYAVGKAFNDLGDYEQAMSTFDFANRLRRSLFPSSRFDRADMTARVDHQIRTFTKARIAGWEERGLDSDLPIFVAGMIRSGTTLTEQILSCHSEIAAGGELSYWVDHIYDVASPSEGFDPAKARGYAQEYLKILEAGRRGKPFVIDKNPLNIWMAGTLRCVLPKARILHTKRNAVDNLLSIWMTPMEGGFQYITSRADLVFAYREYLRLTEHFEEAMPVSRYRTVSYEELTSQPDSTIRGIVDFLGVRMEESCLHPELNRRTVKTPSMFQVRRQINTDSQARWKRYEAWLGPFAELIGS